MSKLILKLDIIKIEKVGHISLKCCFLYVLTIILLFIATLCQAQLRHSISISGKLYGNFFTQEKEKFGSYSKELWDTWLPRVNYKIEHNQHGLELYFSHSSSFYNDWSDQWLGDNYQIIQMIQFGAGINYNYRYYTHERFSLSLLAGLNYADHRATIDHGTIGRGGRKVGGTGGNLFGLQLGHNIQTPIWRGIFVNMNVRYTRPFTNDEILRQHLIIELGAGYTWQRKRTK